MIKVKNIFKSFKNEVVLKDINLEIKKNELIVLSGVSGSGKSTLLSIIASIMKPTSGAVEVDGINIVSLNDFHLSAFRTKTVGFVTQAFHLFDMLSVKENIIAPLVLQKLSQEEISQKVQSVMEIASIAHKSQSVVSTLSGGEKQRCMIARALINMPDILLCDEPTANLDKENSLKFIAILKSLKQSGITIIIATHDPLLINLEWIDRVIEMKEGRVE